MLLAAAERFGLSAPRYAREKEAQERARRVEADNRADAAERDRRRRVREDEERDRDRAELLDDARVAREQEEMRRRYESERSAVKARTARTPASLKRRPYEASEGDESSEFPRTPPSAEAARSIDVSFVGRAASAPRSARRPSSVFGGPSPPVRSGGGRRVVA